jgi:hypothetical protein
MKNQVETLFLKDGQVSHVAFDCDQGKIIAFGNQAVLLQLLGRIIEYRHTTRTRRGEYWSLLPAA